jgi:hypothetical protein
MRCTGEPHTGHGFLKRPCTAISSWNAVTFSGKPAPVSARSGAVHFSSVARAAHGAAGERVERRIVGAQDERAQDPDLVQALPDHVPREGLSR